MSAPQIIYQADTHLNGPVEVDGSIFLASQKGDIIGWKDDQHKIEFNIPGQPSSVAYDKNNNVFYIADMARQSILKRNFEENNQELSEFISEYEGMPLLGPHSIIYTNNAIFFTDSGPFGETAIDNCKGSLLMADLENLIIKPIALYCLSYPSGLCVGNDQKTIYLCETGKNRVLRFVQGNANIYYFSVYIQFQGRYGPVACAIAPNEHLYVARFEFQQVTEDGLISVYNQNGVNIENIILPSYPELTGLCFSTVKPGLLYVVDNSNNGKCLKLQVNQNEKKDKDRFK